MSLWLWLVLCLHWVCFASRVESSLGRLHHVTWIVVGVVSSTVPLREIGFSWNWITSDTFISICTLEEMYVLFSC